MEHNGLILFLSTFSLFENGVLNFVHICKKSKYEFCVQGRHLFLATALLVEGIQFDVLE